MSISLKSRRIVTVIYRNEPKTKEILKKKIKTKIAQIVLCCFYFSCGFSQILRLQYTTASVLSEIIIQPYSYIYFVAVYNHHIKRSTVYRSSCFAVYKIAQRSRESLYRCGKILGLDRRQEQRKKERETTKDV